MKKYYRKLTFSLLTTATCLLVSFSTPINTQAAEQPSPTICQSDSVYETRSNNIGWRYKTKNGKKYKRLYNYDTKKWIGDWILIK